MQRRYSPHFSIRNGLSSSSTAGWPWTVMTENARVVCWTQNLSKVVTQRTPDPGHTSVGDPEINWSQTGYAKGWESGSEVHLHRARVFCLGSISACELPLVVANKSSWLWWPWRNMALPGFWGSWSALVEMRPLHVGVSQGKASTCEHFWSSITPASPRPLAMRR